MLKIGCTVFTDFAEIDYVDRSIYKIGTHRKFESPSSNTLQYPRSASIILVSILNANISTTISCITLNFQQLLTVHR